MCDYHFTSDLDIKPSNTLFETQSEEELSAEIKELKEQMLQLSRMIESKQETLQKLQENRKPQETAIQFMKENGINVHLSDTSNLRFAIIDSSEVWFGYLNLLGGSLGKDYKDAEQKVMMHISNPHVAKTLIESEYELF